jgi:enamine deaminase RidA (YjgF/YER057c/UK114 family)
VKAAAFLLALAASAPAAAQGAREQATVLMSESPGGRESQEKWGYNDAIVVGDTVYLSGVVAGKRPDEQSLEPAYERAYRQIAAVLQRAGASWDDVVDITSFHTDVERQIDFLAAVHKRHVKAPYPAWTAVGVARILGNGITEIKVVAKRRAAAAGKPGGISKE